MKRPTLASYGIHTNGNKVLKANVPAKKPSKNSQNRFHIILLVAQGPFQGVDTILWTLNGIECFMATLREHVSQLECLARLGSNNLKKITIRLRTWGNGVGTANLCFVPECQIRTGPWHAWVYGPFDSTAYGALQLRLAMERARGSPTVQQIVSEVHPEKGITLSGYRTCMFVKTRADLGWVVGTWEPIASSETWLALTEYLTFTWNVQTMSCSVKSMGAMSSNPVSELIIPDVEPLWAL